LTHVGQQAVEIAASNAIAISRVTLAPLEPREREVADPAFDQAALDRLAAG
jgi:hypothetical protein